MPGKESAALNSNQRTKPLHKRDKERTYVYTHIYIYGIVKWFLNFVPSKRDFRPPSPLQPEKLHFHLFFINQSFFVTG